ncbi:ATP-binding protein [Nonomuraea sp. NPDC046802]|uniref:ATP-binding protein n=1 Tax=Nonomuraea sp. NPDC046802 TaxID=3154919 RepID=UPI0033CBDE2A
MLASAHVNAMIELTPGGLAWRRGFPGTLDQVAEARYFARFLLADSARKDDAELIVTELAANAVQHTSSGHLYGTFIVEITRTTTVITIAVNDCGWGGTPHFGVRCSGNAQHGRGLTLVAALADQVGYDGDDESGHRVWARLYLSQP